MFAFLAATVAALEHECAHAIAARKRGYTLEKITLMPYGAVVSGEMSGMSPKEQILVYAAGPLSNAVTALFFVALWWLFPETYPYTDTAMYVSCSLFFVNLLPALPLDGGRMLLALLQPIGQHAKKIVTAVSLFVVLAIFGYFCVTCVQGKPSWTTFAFAVLLVAGLFGKEGYRRISFSKDKAFWRGVEERRVAISAERDLSYAVRFLREDRYLVLELFLKEKFLAELTEEELLHAIDGGDWTLTLLEVANNSSQFCVPSVQLA
jgi:stage IV sporulation protein FB